MQDIPLTVIRGGINRLRVKGGARADSLYDLLNGFVTDSATVKIRPGTVRVAQLNPVTRGLCSFGGSIHVFASEVVDVPDGYTLNVLTHPDSTEDTPIVLDKIYFAVPYLGFLYVVAKFDNGDVFHFWLRSSGTWTADTVYKNGDVVTPTVPNGLLYQATRVGAPLPSWAPNVPRAVNDTVEPTVYNDFFYTVVDVTGATPRSGTVEPIWPEQDGAQVTEDVDGILSSTAVSTPATGDTAVPESVQERYE